MRRQKLTVPVAFPQFNRKYGEQLPDGTWQVPAPWQAGLSNVSPPSPSLTSHLSPLTPIYCLYPYLSPSPTLFTSIPSSHSPSHTPQGAHVGEIIGLFINGWVSERFGYRYTVLTCLVLVAAFTTIFFTAQNVQTLLAAEILCGVPWGIFQTLTITYATECAPLR